MKPVAAEAPAASRRGLFTSLLDSRSLCGWILGAAAVHVALAATPLGGWPCPFREVTGWPCPGCGLGRSCVLLLRGEISEAMRQHAFGGLLFVALAIVGAGVLPGTAGKKVREIVRRIEERTWLVPATLAALLLYWVARFALDADAFRALVV